MHAGIYARISLDRHDGEGVARQLDDCRTEAARRGWTTTEYVDNDISAYRSKARPEWERLLADLHAGALGAIIAYHPDRLYRRLGDLERLIAAVDASNATIVTIKAGRVDLSTATGRMTARIIGSVAAGESERMGERVARAKKQRATEGRPSGGGRRPYGLTADRQHIVAAEAQHLQETAAAILGGASIGSQVRRLNDAGATTTTGRPWTAGTLRRVLTAPHVAGLRTYHGQVVADTITPPILDRDTWDALRLTALGRARPGRPASDRYLLTGLVRCAACDLPMYGQERRGHTTYRCPPPRGCGRSIIAHPLDEVLLAAVEAIFDDEGWQADVEEGQAAVVPLHAVGEVQRLERKLQVEAKRYGLDEISYDEWEALRQPIIERLAQIATPAPERPVLGHLPDDWREEPVDVQRAVIRTVVEVPIFVGPGRSGDGGRVPIVERVTITPRWTA